MVSFCFTISFMLVLLMSIFLTIKDTVAESDQARKSFVFHEAENGVEVALTSRDLSVEKEILDGVPTAAVLTNDKIGGRKMMIERRNMKKHMKLQAEGIKTEENSKNSGSSNNSSANPLGDSPQNIHHQKLEAEKLLEDETEILNMMNKDYTGTRHKPPINNYQPFHGSNP